MSAFANLVLVNNAAANVTFVPSSIDASGVATWREQVSVFDAARRVTMSVSLPKNGGTVARVKQKVVIPIMDSVDTSKKIAEAYVNVEYVFPKQASDTVRLDARKFVDTLILHAVSTAAVQSLESIY